MSSTHSSFPKGNDTVNISVWVFVSLSVLSICLISLVDRHGTHRWSSCFLSSFYLFDQSISLVDRHRTHRWSSCFLSFLYLFDQSGWSPWDASLIFLLPQFPLSVRSSISLVIFQIWKNSKNVYISSRITFKLPRSNHPIEKAHQIAIVKTR